MATERVYIEIDNEIIELNPDYDMDDVIRWANSDYYED
jgi:hypothetical protein